jgi:hypothetical protein
MRTGYRMLLLDGASARATAAQGRQVQHLREDRGEILVWSN